jgi:predicted O-methyltransferase YrrM
MIEFPFDNIDGMLSQEDRFNLRNLSARCEPLNRVMFEVGSYVGLSALCIIDGWTTDSKLYCYDWFEEPKLLKFVSNVKKHRFGTYVETVSGDFKKFSPHFATRFSFGFIDHTHNLEDTKAAYDMFWPHISVGGILCFHDYTHPDYQEPRAFLDSLPHKRILEGSILAFLKE